MTSMFRVIQSVRAFVLVIAVLHVIRFALAALNIGTVITPPGVPGFYSEVSVGIFTFDIDNSAPQIWTEVARQLEQAEFNSTVILGCAAMLPYLALYYLLFSLFGLYAKEQVFTVAATRKIKLIALTLLGWVGLVWAYPFLIGVLMYWFGLTEELSVYTGISSPELVRLVVGMVLYIAAWVMLGSVELREKNELAQHKEQMFANISHEFKTPLTLILTPIEALQASATGAQQKQLSMMKRNGYRLLRMIEQMLELSKLELKQSATMQYYSLKTTLDVLLASFEPLFADKKLILHCDEFTDVVLLLKADTLDMILTNLLSNAIKYTPQNGKITLAVHSDKKQLKLSVSDSGIGITAEDLKIVFDRFVRVDEYNDENVPGAGIGLALVKELVESHQGTITLSSEPGQGSTFTVTLPIYTDQTVSVESVNGLSNSALSELESLQSSDSQPSSPLNEPLQSTATTTILLIDDNADMLALLENTLTPDYHCLMAANGKRGVELAKEQMPDLVISDLMMPGISGFDVVRQLKHDQVTCHIPVVLLTAKSDVESRMQGWREKADEYLEKPFNAAELLTRVDNLLAIRSLLRHRFGREFSEPEKVTAPQAKAEQEQPVLNPAHQLFVDKLNQVLEENYSDPDFTVKLLAQHMQMGDRQFHRKTKSLIDLSPVEAIRHYRLKKAAEQLVQGVSPSVIYFQVGFSSHSYFSMCFKAQYQCKPSDYINNH